MKKKIGRKNLKINTKNFSKFFLNSKLIIFLGILFILFFVFGTIFVLEKVQHKNDNSLLKGSMNNFNKEKNPAPIKDKTPKNSEKIDQEPIKKSLGGGNSEHYQITDSAHHVPGNGSGLMVINLMTNNSDIGGSNMNIQHDDAFGYSKEGEDILDGTWANAPDGFYNYWLRISSNPFGVELQSDFRPADSLSTINLTLSVMHNQGGSKSVNTGAYLVFGIQNDAGEQFGTKTITFQQYDPDNPSKSYPVYDVRDLITNHGGRLDIDPVSGSYTNGDDFAHFKLMFS